MSCDKLGFMQGYTMKVKSNSVSQKTPKLRTKKVMRNRIKYTDVQLACLEKVFCHTQYPDTYTMEELTKTLDINGERLAIWFQNRRSKFKRQSKDGYVSWMRNQLYQSPHTQPAGMQPVDGHVLSASVQTTWTEPNVRRPSSNLHYMPPAYRPYAVPSFPLASCRYQLSQSTMFSSPLLSTNQPDEMPLSRGLPQRGVELSGQGMTTPLIIPSSVNRQICEPLSASSCPRSQSTTVAGINCTLQSLCVPEYYPSNSMSPDCPCTGPKSLKTHHPSISSSPLSVTSSDTSPPGSPQVILNISSDMSSATPMNDLVINEAYYRQETTVAGVRSFTYQDTQSALHPSSQHFGC
ncbi:paired box protein Pax-6-like [Gigantopelta aegis]|uniref:paired box protein Pax-6-like n=1 Tax=Gigantopelta aegis TaxID=1735272 RepID=UPI001B88B42C|nr:paired box protein Pax-6-like [Gigantopelta aegis]